MKSKRRNQKKKRESFLDSESENDYFLTKREIKGYYNWVKNINDLKVLLCHKYSINWFEKFSRTMDIKNIKLILKKMLLENNTKESNLILNILLNEKTSNFLKILKNQLIKIDDEDLISNFLYKIITERNEMRGNEIIHDIVEVMLDTYPENDALQMINFSITKPIELKKNKIKRKTKKVVWPEFSKERHSNDKIDIINISIKPTKDHIISTIEPYLPSVFAATNPNQYREVWFRALHQDCIGVIQDSIENFKLNNKKSKSYIITSLYIEEVKKRFTENYVCVNFE